VAEPAPGSAVNPIEVTPVVVLFQVFPARPSSIPDIRDFVRRCLAESPLTEDGNREVGETVFKALLDAAGPTGSIHVAFRIFPEHVEVDVLHSDSAVPAAQPAQAPGPPGGAGAIAPGRPPEAADGRRTAPVITDGRGGAPAGHPDQAENFAAWMATALRKEGLTQEAAARLLGVSVKTVSRWVGGTTEPRLRDLRRIQEIFGQVPLD
jgi:DNA-binding XRE family transcriptional regulator